MPSTSLKLHLSGVPGLIQEFPMKIAAIASDKRTRRQKSSNDKGLKREKKRTTTTRKKREEVRKGVERDGNWWRAGGPAAVHEHKHQLRSKLGFTGKPVRQ